MERVRYYVMAGDCLSSEVHLRLDNTEAGSERGCERLERDIESKVARKGTKNGDTLGLE